MLDPWKKDTVSLSVSNNITIIVKIIKVKKRRRLVWLYLDLRILSKQNFFFLLVWRLHFLIHVILKSDYGQFYAEKFQRFQKK